jgi:hypothetical protein
MRKQMLASFLLNCKKHEEINNLVDDIKIKVILKLFSLLTSVHSLLKHILSKPTYRSSISKLSSKGKKKNPLLDLHGPGFVMGISQIQIQTPKLVLSL